VAAGFVDFEITWQADVFSGAPQQSSAADFGTLGINFRARKAIDTAEWSAVLEALACEASSQAGVEERMTSVFGAEAFYDAGDTACTGGALDDIAVVLLRLAPGQTLEVRATHPNAATELPAWCRLAGHELARQQGDRYLIRYHK
jgi:hypothetical protein